MLSLDLDGFLKALKALPLAGGWDATDEAFVVSRDLRDKLTAVYGDAFKNPTGLSDEILDSLETVAQSSPYNDINDPHEHHVETLAQGICLYALNIFEGLAETVPQKSEAIIQRLENIAQSSLDYYIRHETIMCLWGLSEEKEPCKSYAVAALERQGEQNSNAYIRMLARDQLLMASGEQEDIIPRAINAFIQGTEDTDPEARIRAFAMLGNRVISSSCPDDEARSLLSVFEKAAVNLSAAEKNSDATRIHDKSVTYWVERGLVEGKKRLKVGPKPSYKFP